MLREMLGMIVIGMLLFVILAIVCAPLIMVGVLWDNNACHDFGRQVYYPVRWSLWSGCYVQIDGNWVPGENFWQYVRLAPSGGE